MDFICRQIDFATPEFDLLLKLRDKILRKPLNMVFTEEQIEAEYDMIHLACFEAGTNELLACLILKKISHIRMKMRQVAVDEHLQGKGIGSILVKYSETYALQNKVKTMELNARDTAIPFYLKLGYEKVGKEFEEVGIPHFKMVKKLR